MPKSPEEMAAAMVANLKDNTGKTLEQWRKVAKAAKLQKHGALVKLLKTEHGVTHGYANLIAHDHFQNWSVASSDDDLVAAQYAGAKAELKPIYDVILAAVNKFGDDVVVSPKNAYVALRRGKQFGLIKPSTKDRIDVGLNLKGVEPEGRLEPAGSLGGMVSHRIQVTKKKDVDATLKRWLKQAYDNA